MKPHKYLASLLAVVTSIVVFTSGAKAQVVVANYQNENFSNTHNPTSASLGWNYFYTSATYGVNQTVTLGTYTSAFYWNGAGNPANAGWGGGGGALMNQSDGAGARVGQVLTGDGNAPVIAEWTSDVNAATLTVAGSFRRLASGQSNFGNQNVYIRLNSNTPILLTSVVYNNISTNTFSYDISNLVVGDKVALVVGGNGNNWGGESILNATYSIPEPTTWALLAGSLTVVTILRRRRKS
ncbi:MAG: PEP-CTERM sorting domain-containing protein [Verrucomicrobia bacterium]|nr:PEP-CTERM sorting domain-containing protein [Verrucomicrobiota bacterium]